MKLVTVKYAKEALAEDGETTFWAEFGRNYSYTTTRDDISVGQLIEVPMRKERVPAIVVSMMQSTEDNDITFADINAEIFKLTNGGKFSLRDVDELKPVETPEVL